MENSDRRRNGGGGRNETDLHAWIRSKNRRRLPPQKAPMRVSCHVCLAVGRGPPELLPPLSASLWRVQFREGGGFDEHVLPFPLDSQRLNSAKSFSPGTLMMGEEGESGKVRAETRIRA